MKQLAALLLIISLMGCGGTEDQASLSSTDDITNEFLSLTAGAIYKQGDVEMFFTPDRRVIMRKFNGCKMAILGINVTVRRFQNSSGIMISYEEHDARPVDVRVTDDSCAAELEDYRQRLPLTQTMVFCGYTRKKLDAACGNEELSSFNWY